MGNMLLYLAFIFFWGTERGIFMREANWGTPDKKRDTYNTAFLELFPLAYFPTQLYSVFGGSFLKTDNELPFCSSNEKH